MAGRNGFRVCGDAAGRHPVQRAQPVGQDAAFQEGSHLGNLAAGSIFTLASALVLFAIHRPRLGQVSGAHAACGLIGLGIHYPAAVLGFGMAHVVAHEGEAPAQGGVALNLVLSGGIALLILLCRLPSAGRRPFPPGEAAAHDAVSGDSRRVGRLGAGHCPVVPQAGEVRLPPGTPTARISPLNAEGRTGWSPVRPVKRRLGRVPGCVPGGLSA